MVRLTASARYRPTRLAATASRTRTVRAVSVFSFDMAVGQTSDAPKNPHGAFQALQLPKDGQTAAAHSPALVVSVTAKEPSASSIEMDSTATANSLRWWPSGWSAVRDSTTPASSRASRRR